jgi:U3 small nucleolar RNA-associated protein MPP10
MMNPKSWEMVGEAAAKDRPVNSLLEVHLDFNAATKLPPTITKETTNTIEALVKQRVLDELFDDPILKNASQKRKLGEEEKEMDFNKSKKGLGDLYADDLTARLTSLNPEAFLEGELAGPDGPLKREIEDIATDLLHSLDVLSNFHYTPSAPKTEASIQTQNVPSLMLEDAVPIHVSKGATKSAKEVFAVNALAMREKTELTKEEKRKERASRKRQIKASLKAKATFKKEKMREQGIAMAEKFAVRDAQRQMEKMNKKLKKKGVESDQGP